MFKTYLTVLWRNLRKRKSYAIINLLGLATGMAVCMLLVLYIQNELGYDTFHEKGDRIYRLALERKYPGRSTFFGSIPPSIGKVVQQDFPEVRAYTRLMNVAQGGLLMTAGDKTFEETHVLEVDSNFFRVFSVEVLQGDVHEALSKPNTVVLTEKTAIRYFGSAEVALGKTIVQDGGRKLLVGSVVRDWPEKSHMTFDMLLSMMNATFDPDPDYYDLYTYTYLLLKNGTSARVLESKLPQIVTKYVAGSIQQGFGESYEQFVHEGNGYRYFLQPLPDIHLTSELEDELKPTGSLRIVTLFSLVAAFILFLACINFVNLSTALSLDRAREVGVRKVFGSDRKTLIGQFLSESVFLGFLSTLLGVVIYVLLVPVLNRITGESLNVTWLLRPERLGIVIGMGLFVGALAGLYPALVLSGFQPITVLKGRLKSSRRGLALRNGLVVFQFSVSIILIICTLVINRQMGYVLEDRLGFRKDHIITVKQIWKAGEHANAFVQEVGTIPGVHTVSLCSDLPGQEPLASCAMQIVGTRVSRTQETLYADDQYANLLGLHLREGRFFDPAFPTDSFALVLNQSAVRDFGLKNPIGARITSTETFFNPPGGKTQTVYTVIGVVDDFHFQSLHRSIAPLVIANRSRFGGYNLGIRVEGNHLENALAQIQSIWKGFDAKYPMRYSFLDQDLADQYKVETTSRRIFTVFSMLAIFIACIGLFGLATYATYQRTREVGIRKVLGASTGSILYLLTRSFLRLVLIALCIAVPVAWWAMHGWLQDFAYRTSLSWWIFGLAGVGTLVVAFSTISFQTVRAALMNPVKSLRTE